MKILIKASIFFLNPAIHKQNPFTIDSQHHDKRNYQSYAV